MKNSCLQSFVFLLNFSLHNAKFLRKTALMSRFIIKIHTFLDITIRFSFFKLWKYTSITIVKTKVLEV